MNFDRRSEARERIKLPVSLSGGRSGHTLDVSPSGVFFEFNGRLEAGSTIELSIALPDGDRPMRLKAQAMVVRVESRGRSFGVGVRLLSSTLEQVNAVARDSRYPAVSSENVHGHLHRH